MASVDGIWEEMQREQPKKKIISLKASSKDLSSLQVERTKPKNTKKLDSSLSWMQSWSINLKNSQDYKSSTAGNTFAGEDATLSLLEPPSTLVDVITDVLAGSPDTFLAYIQRDINCLGEEQLSVRLQSLQKLQRLLVEQVEMLSTDTINAVSESLLKPLLKRMKDKSEKCRECAIKILCSLVENTSDLVGMLPYVFPTLVSRLGSEDLDGVAHLPEVMRPDPEQKPVEIARPVEESEELRFFLSRLVASLLARLNPAQVYSYIDEATGLLRAGAMDPYHEVKALSCETMIAFCHNNQEMLLHFALPMSRSLTSCFTHNHARIRIIALRALTALLWCGVWKHNFEIMQVLMAWQDPNKVPIRAFYESCTNVNYMSTLSFDRHPAVRRFWFETLAYWLLRVPDKVDHEPYIFPYLLAGLCDENEDIALEVFWLIERCGELYESEHEADLRKTKQYGFDYSWTYQGRASVPFPLQAVWGGQGVDGHVRRTSAQGPDFLGEQNLAEHRSRDAVDEVGEDLEDQSNNGKTQAKLGDEVPLPERDYCWPDFRDFKVFKRLPRPRLGSRCWVRTHTRRYIKATFNDVVDFRDCTTLNAGRLLCMSIAYTEEGVTEWLQPMVAALCKFFSGRAWAASQGDAQVILTYSTVCRLLGAFLEPVSIWAQMRNALEPDSILDIDQRIASVRILALCIEGHIQTIQSIQPPDPSLGLGQLAPVIPELISAVHSSDLLLSSTKESREVLWMLISSFLEPLCPSLSDEDVSQLLFVTLALSSRQASEASTPGEISLRLDLENEAIEDAARLKHALAILSRDLQGVSTAEQKTSDFSLDSLDDDAALADSLRPEVTDLDPSQILLRKTFLQVIEKADVSFQIYRSVLSLTSLEVVLAGRNYEPVLRRLEQFCGFASNDSVRCAAQLLGVQLSLGCANLAALQQGSSLQAKAVMFMQKVFHILVEAHAQHLSGCGKKLSFHLLMSLLGLWRQFFLTSVVDPALVLLPNDWTLQEASCKQSPLDMMVSIFADQELYKRLHAALEYAEMVLTGRDKENFVVAKARKLREDSERQASVARACAASNLLVGLRRMLLQKHWQQLPFFPRDGPQSSRSFFSKAASLLSTAKPELDPPFVRPTPPSLLIYASELLFLLLHLPTRESARDRLQADAASSFCLVDDAERAIHHLSAPSSTPCLPDGISLSPDEEDELVTNYVTCLIDLNLTLPPDPQAKNVPATLDTASSDISIGWDESLRDSESSRSDATCKSNKSSPAIPADVSRLLGQSHDCLRWNAALALYKLGLDFAVVFPDGFRRSNAKWLKRKEPAKVIIAKDVVDRSHRAYAVSAKSSE